jgi:CHASE2 domain-containing sensor protein
LTIPGLSGTVIFAGNLVVFLLGIVLFFGCIFIPSPIAVVIGTIIGVAVASVLFFITGAYFLGGTFIFLVVAGGIVVWRLRNGGND